MKHEIIKTDNYLLVVDESEIKEGDWHLSNDVMITKSHLIDENCKKIIAHLPLNGSPILEGVDLLPPLEEEDVEKLALDIFPRHEDWRLNSDNADKRPIWVDGYNKAKEKYKYTEEDMRKAFLKGVSVTAEGYNAEYAQGNEPDIECVFGEEADEFIQSLSEPKMPIGFECETDYYGGETKWVKEITTTPEGHTQWVGTYIFN